MARARLEVSDALGVRVVPIDVDRFSIGRRNIHDLYLTGGDISREHAEIERRGGRFTLKDRGSRLGTFVNGEPIAERVLEDGDRIHLGRTSGADLVFRIERARTVAPPSSTADLHQIAALLDGLRALGSGRVLDEVLAIVLDSAITVSGAERGFVMLADEQGRLEFTQGRARKGVALSGQAFQTSRKIPEEVFASGQRRVVPDLLDEDPDQHAGTIALGIRHVLAVPLIFRSHAQEMDAKQASRPLGVLYLDGRDKGRLLSPETTNTLDTLAAEAALAIENARLYGESLEKARLEQQMKTAAQIQQALFPRPTHRGDRFEIACASSPCLTIGGDFFDYFDLPAGRFGFLLGDVSGKGLPAALLTAMLQGIFATEAVLGRTAADAMGFANATLIRKAEQSRYATVFYAVLDPDGHLTYANAGHNPPLHVSRRGIDALRQGSTILGAFPDVVYDQAVITLEPGDSVVVFSDGVTEAFNDEWDEFGEERLVQCIQESAALPPQELLARVMDAVRTFAGGARQSDDQTVVVLRWLGDDAHTGSARS